MQIRLESSDMTMNSQDKTAKNQTSSRYLRIFRMHRFRVSLRKLQYPRQLVLWVFFLLLSVLLVRIQSLCNCQLYLTFWKNQGGLCLAEFRASWLFLGRVDQFFFCLLFGCRFMLRQLATNISSLSLSCFLLPF